MIAAAVVVAIVVRDVPDMLREVQATMGHSIRPRHVQEIELGDRTVHLLLLLAHPSLPRARLHNLLQE